MGVRHKFTSGKADGSDTTVVRPSDWNDDHDFPPMSHTLIGTTLTVTNIPAAVTEFPGLYRTKLDLTNADQVRLVARVGVAGSASAVLKAQYSTDESAWSDLTPTASLAAVATPATAWAAVPAGAKADVFIRLVTSGGDGAADPQVRQVQLQVR